MMDESVAAEKLWIDAGKMKLLLLMLLLLCIT